jgi:threonine/homoserine/homoserine lactone efflux protein
MFRTAVRPTLLAQLLRETHSPMTYFAYLSAVLALLLAPGPTNTLMGIAGARGGLGASAKLLPAELAGYLTTILPLTWLGAELLARFPSASVTLKVVAAVWVMFLAVRLWRMPADAQNGGGVTAGRVYLTTVLNPKALIFGLVLLPAPADSQFLPRLAAFCIMVSGVAMLWGSFGRLTQAGDGGNRRLLLVQRAASIWLAFVSVTLITGVLRA